MRFYDYVYRQSNTYKKLNFLSIFYVKIKNIINVNNCPASKALCQSFSSQFDQYIAISINWFHLNCILLSGFLDITMAV